MSLKNTLIRGGIILLTTFGGGGVLTAMANTPVYADTMEQRVKPTYGFAPDNKGSLNFRLTFKELNDACLSNKRICSIYTVGKKGDKDIRMTSGREEILQKLVDNGKGTVQETNKGKIFRFGEYVDRRPQIKKLNDRRKQQAQSQKAK
jgi:hypothetical protein